MNVYIDSKDPTMPAVTSVETALNIKERIKQRDKFILLATNGAVESKWCNWELGYGDAQKYKKHIALFSMKPEGSSDSAYKGSEYMSIYPYIAYFDGSEQYKWQPYSERLLCPHPERKWIGILYHHIERLVKHQMISETIKHAVA